MAIAGRSYASVPVIIRGSLEDPSDFGSRTRVIVVTSQPARAQTAVPPVAVTRNTLADPPALTTRAPLVAAAPYDRRWFAPAVVTVTANPQAPAAVAAATPGPLVITAPSPSPKTVQAFIARSTLADPPVLTTRPPVVIAAVPDRRWFAGGPPQVLKGSVPPPPPVTGTGLLLAGFI